MACLAMVAITMAKRTVNKILDQLEQALEQDAEPDRPAFRGDRGL